MVHFDTLCIGRLKLDREQQAARRGVRKSEGHNDKRNMYIGMYGSTIHTNIHISIKESSAAGCVGRMQQKVCIKSDTRIRIERFNDWSLTETF